TAAIEPMMANRTSAAIAVVILILPKTAKSLRIDFPPKAPANGEQLPTFEELSWKKPTGERLTEHCLCWTGIVSGPNKASRLPRKQRFSAADLRSRAYC